MSEVIICPKCKAEYLPSEIFVPKSFFGNPTYIEKTEDGKLLTALGNIGDTKEKYTCDYCNCTFTIDAVTTYKTKILVDEDFSTEYVTKRWEF